MEVLNVSQRNALNERQILPMKVEIWGRKTKYTKE
jgi:hypothetical protein